MGALCTRSSMEERFGAAQRRLLMLPGNTSRSNQSHMAILRCGL